MNRQMKIIAGIVLAGLWSVGGCVQAGEMRMAETSLADTLVVADTLSGAVAETDNTVGGPEPAAMAGSDAVMEESGRRTEEAGGLLNRTQNTPQRLMIDQIVAVVGTKMVKLSDVEKTVESIRMGGTLVNDEVRCHALETMLISNLYALQADEDSISIGENQIEGELEARLAYFTEQIGSREKLEEFYGKTIVQIKEEYREMVKSAIIARTMEGKITEDIRVTPTEVKRFYNLLPKDSIPLVSMQYELSLIVKKPKVSAEEKQVAKARVEALRERIEKGESFASLAALYSEDPGSRRRGGELGYGARGEWASEFESFAFSLPENELSPVFETQFGFHILEVLEKKGELVKVRHILIQPKPSVEDQMRARTELDSVARLIKNGELTFEEAVKLFSDEAGRQADGVYLSPYTGKPSYSSEEIDPIIFMSVERLAQGEVSMSVPYQDESGNEAYRIFYVRKKIPAHRANLEDDYDRIYEMALEKVKQDKLDGWLKEKIANTYVRLIGRYAQCKFRYNWQL